MSNPQFANYRCVQAPVFATNTVIVESQGSAIIVDAGAGVAAAVRDVIANTGWQPVAILITHGHVDHIWDAATLSATWDIPVLVSDADRYQFDDPFGLDPNHPERHDPHRMLVQAFSQYGLYPDDFRQPSRIVTPADDQGREALVQLTALWDGGFRAIPAPGHTPGATLYEFAAPGSAPLVCSGDVLFKSSIGRTDLPGGDDATMRATLRHLAGDIAPESLIIPGHGPTTTMASELATNPYLRAAAAH